MEDEGWEGGPFESTTQKDWSQSMMKLPSDFEVMVPGGQTAQRVRHVPTSIVYQLIPGGSVRCGFSEQEEEALRDALLDSGDDDSEAGLGFLDSLGALRPVAEVTIAPFLLAPEPLTQSQLVAILGANASPELGDLEDCLSSAVAEQVAAVLRTHGLRLPTELEWEYTYRAGTVGPFPWGTDRPESPWAPENRFGLEGMGEFAELCADGWQDSHEGAPCDGSVRNSGGRPRVARGGAAEVWPWQGVAEWVTLLSAYRSPSSEHDGFLRIRPARSLP